MKFNHHFNAVCIIALLALFPKLSSAAADAGERVLLSHVVAATDFHTNRPWQEDRRKQEPSKGEKSRAQDKRTSVKEVPKAKPKLRPENVNNENGNKRPASKGRK